MSDHLYPRRIYYDMATGGSLVVGAVYRPLFMPPHIPGLPEFDAIDFAGIFYVPEIRPLRERKREMTAAEIRAVDAWLDQQQPDPVCPLVERRHQGES